MSVSIWRIGIAFVVCVAAAYAAVLLIRRRSGNGGVRLRFGGLPLRTRRIEVVETRRLSNHADISLVREGGREYLLLLFAGGSEVLRDGAAESGEEVPLP